MADRAAILKAELDNDPLARGYAGMTDQEVADSLNTEDRPGPDRDTVTGRELYQDIVSPGEMAALSADQKEWLGYAFHMATLDVAAGSNFLTNFGNLFNPASVTRNALAAIRAALISRAAELGLPPVQVDAVAYVRSLP